MLVFYETGGPIRVAHFSHVIIKSEDTIIFLISLFIYIYYSLSGIL